MEACNEDDEHSGWEVFEDLAAVSTIDPVSYSSTRSVESLVSEIKTLGPSTNGNTIHNLHSSPQIKLYS